MGRPLSFVCCGVRVDLLPLESSVETVIELATGRGGAVVHLCNAYTLALASRDTAYAEVLNRGTVNLPDGASLVFLGRRLHRLSFPLAHRPRGADVLALTVDRGRRLGLRHFLYGSDAATLAALRQRLEMAYPGAEIAGADPAPFRPVSDDEASAAVERIAAAGAHVVWVALGTPRQDHVIEAFRDRLDATLVGVGAAFDFVAGTKPAAPRWIQRSGLEWAFRLATEPRRLWKRYLVSNAVFLWCARRSTGVADRGRPVM